VARKLIEAREAGHGRVWKKRVAALLVGAVLAVAVLAVWPSKASALVAWSCPGGQSVSATDASDAFAQCWLSRNGILAMGVSSSGLAVSDVLATYLPAINTNTSGTNSNVGAVKSSVDAINSFLRQAGVLTSSTSGNGLGDLVTNLQTTSSADLAAVQQLPNLVTSTNSALGTLNTTATAAKTSDAAIATATAAMQTAINTLNSYVGTSSGNTLNSALVSLNSAVSTLNSYVGTSTGTTLNSLDVLIKGSLDKLTTSASTDATTQSAMSSTLTAMNTALSNLNTAIASNNTLTTSTNSTLSTINTAIGTLNTATSTGNASLASIASTASALETALNNLKASQDAGNTSAAAIASASTAINTALGGLVSTVGGISSTLAGIFTFGQQQAQGMGSWCKGQLSPSGGPGSGLVASYSFAPSQSTCPAGTTDSGPVNDGGLIPLLNGVGDAAQGVEKAIGDAGQGLVNAICGTDNIGGAGSCLSSLFGGGEGFGKITSQLQKMSDAGQAASDCANDPACVGSQYGNTIGQQGPGIGVVKQPGGLLFGAFNGWLPVETDTCTLSLTLQFPGQTDDLPLCPPANIAGQWTMWRSVLGWLLVLAATVAAAARIGRAANTEVSA